MQMDKTRILLVDDHAIVRLGLMTLLNDQPDMEVIAEASTAAEAVRAVEKFQPDVVLMDIRLPGEGGIEATRQVTSRFPKSKVVMLTSFADYNLIIRAYSAPLKPSRKMNPNTMPWTTVHVSRRFIAIIISPLIIGS